MSDLMKNIHDSIPGHKTATETLAKLDAVPMPVTSGALTPADHLAAEVIERLSADKPLDLIAGAAAAVAEINSVLVAREALVRAREQLKTQIRELKAGNPDDILTGLNGSLTKLVGQVRKLGPLSEITSEAGAIASDRTKDFKTLRSLAPQYVEIRREQVRIMTEQTGGELGIAEVLFASNLPSLFPLWAPWRSHGYLQHDNGSRTRNIRPPWPVNDSESRTDHDLRPVSRENFVKDASTPGFLFWAIEAGADLWVPNLEQYVEAGEKHHALLSREVRRGVIDEHWLDPGGIDVGAPARGLSRESRTVSAAIRTAERVQ